MHDDGGDSNPDDWEAYITKLNTAGNFQGGSSIGKGICVSKSGDSAAITGQLSGYMRISAENLEDAKKLIVGNPVFEAGGTVEIRELPKS